MSDKVGPEQGQEKSLDSTSALQKVLKLDKKLTNFDYEDSFRSIAFRVTYPQIVTEGPSSQTLLKSLWKHVNNYYFKKVEDPQYDRLNYIGSIINSPTEEGHRFTAQEEFYSLLHETFTEKYNHRYVFSEREKADFHAWMEFLFMGWKAANASDPKAARKRHNEFLALKNNIRGVYRTKNVSELHKLHLEREELGKSLEAQSYSQDDDEVSESIRQLQRQIQEVKGETRPIFDRLKKRVEREMEARQLVYCQNGEQQQELSQAQVEREAMRVKMNRLGEFDVQTQYIEYIINFLQKKQIAESVSKLYRVERQKGEVKFHLHFEQAMGIKPLIISQEEFTRINELREYSLLKYYNTASKTRYSFICQNYLGFKDIFENRHRPCKNKNKDMVDQMKKSPVDSINASYYKEFNRMEICHHCKLLHHEDNLITCDYHSSKFGNPIPPSPYYDSYTFQILKNEQSRTSAIRYLNSTEFRRNSYYYYNKQNDQYICGRKYCKYCLKNYDDGKQKSSGLCPFCRGICYCTRCARNDMMIRLKSMYILVGGEITKLQRNNHFESYYQNSEEQMDLRKKDKSGKISRKPLNVPTRMNEKMLNIRFQLEDLRLLCDLVKRREKGKEKLLSVQKDTFREKILIKDKEYYGRLEIADEQQPQEQSSQKENERQMIKLSEKLSKKLKRMIN